MNAFLRGKAEKLACIRPLLRSTNCLETETHFDFLTPELREKFRIVDTANVSANAYDPHALELIARCQDGLILDCGAGKQSVPYQNVVNFEIVAYDSTDVLGVGEELPFRDGVFDAVFSLNVLEHVKSPFQCATEIARVLKPGGTLYCVAPFLQPLHGYPHHYYNMSHQGLANLFDGALRIGRQEVVASGLPIWTLSWILRRWAAGLPGGIREGFLQMTVGELVKSPLGHLTEPFVAQLSAEANLELASTTALFATKPAAAVPEQETADSTLASFPATCS